MLKIIGTNIFLTKGDSASILLTPTNSDGTPYTPQEGDQVKCQVRTFPDGGDLIISKTINVSSSGKFTWAITPANTQNAKPGNYYWDAELHTGNNVFTFIPVSRFRILSEVTTNE